MRTEVGDRLIWRFSRF